MTTVAGTSSHPTGGPAAPTHVKLSLADSAQLEAMYRRSLSAGELFLPLAHVPGVGAPVEIHVSMGDAASITLSARVSEVFADAGRAGGRPGVRVRFHPMTEAEYETVASLLRETEEAGPRRLANGTDVGIAAVSGADAELARARAALERGDLDEAGARFDAVLARNPRSEAAARGLVDVAARRRESHRGRLDAILRRSRRD